MARPPLRAACHCRPAPTVSRPIGAAMLPSIFSTGPIPAGIVMPLKLKGVDGGALGDQWLALDEKGRRKLLAAKVVPAPIVAIPEIGRASCRERVWQYG